MKQQPLESSEFLIVFFTLMISLEEQQREMKDALWKLRQVVCLVIIRHVIFTSSPPVVGSCAWLIRAVHSQLAVLWCSSSPCETLYCISTSSQSPDTDCVCLHTNIDLTFHIYFTFFVTVFVRMLVSTCLCANVCFPVYLYISLNATVHIYCVPQMWIMADRTVCRITVCVVIEVWHRCGRPRPPGFVPGAGCADSPSMWRRSTSHLNFISQRGWGSNP